MSISKMFKGVPGKSCVYLLSLVCMGWGGGLCMFFPVASTSRALLRA